MEASNTTQIVQKNIPLSNTLVTIGIVADTHIPDKVNNLHPEILPVLQANSAIHVLHAGDICSRRVLEELNRVAPVTAVRGNRDLFAGSLNMVEIVEFNGVQIALTHGHGNLATYLSDKALFILQGYRLKRYLNLLIKAGKQARVVIFGHTHHPEITWHQNRLLFNPGSASFSFHRGGRPSIGLLHITSQGQVEAEIVSLEGWTLNKREWIKA